MGDTDVGYEAKDPNNLEWTQLVSEAIRSGAVVIRVGEIDGYGALEVSGPCPRCTHELNFVLDLVAITGDSFLTIEKRSADRASHEWRRIPASCRCSQDHKDRPASQTHGCGINFYVDAYL